MSQPGVLYPLRSRCPCARPRARTSAKQRWANAVFRFALVIGVGIGAPTIAAADEGGVSFWIPGLFGSLASTPQQPGWSFARSKLLHDVYMPAATSARRARSDRRNSATVSEFSVNLHADREIWSCHSELRVRVAGIRRPGHCQRDGITVTASTAWRGRCRAH